LGLGRNIKSKMLSHFVRGKFFLTPMETIWIVPKELEYWEDLIKLAKRKKDTKIT
jgi:hypothetical protein